MSIARRMQQAAAGVPSGPVWTDPDLANASYDSVSFSISGQTGAPTDVNISPDGYKIFISANTPDAIFEYDLSTAFDLSTASYNSVSFNTAAANANLTSFTFSSNGLKMYTTDYADDAVYEYDLSSAFDISTASYNSVILNVSAAGNDPQSVAISSDGYKLFVLSLANDTVYQYSLSTAFDISTASYDSVSLSIQSQDSAPSGILFSPVGLTMFMTGGTDRVYMYSLTSAWDLSTASYSGDSFSAASQDTNLKGVAFKTDGSKMYIVGTATDTIYQYSTAAAAPAEWTDPDLANASYDSVSFSVAGQETNPSGIFFSNTGDKLFIVGTASGHVRQYNLSTAWEVNSASYSQGYSVSFQDGFPLGLTFRPDGTKMYVAGNSNDRVYEYSLSLAWDVSSASYVQNFSVASQDARPREVYFKPDGFKMFVVGNSGRDILEYSLGTAWDISTASYLQKFSVASQELDPYGLFMSPDGLSFFVLGRAADTVFQYNMTSPWDISTASYSSDSVSVASQDANPTGIFFKSDGSKMYVVGSANDTIYQYSTD